jgi:hypothetical protein
MASSSIQYQREPSVPLTSLTESIFGDRKSIINNFIGETYYREGDISRNILYEILKPDLSHKLSLINNWRKNRPPDESRINEIISYIKDTGYCDGEVLVAVIPTFGCVCYDGNHRLEAAKRIFPKNGLRLRIVLNATEKFIENEFKRINKGVSVPELYYSTEETSLYLKEVLNDFINNILIQDSRLKNHISSSGHPKRPNFNKDVLLQHLGEYILEYFKNNIGVIKEVITTGILMSWFNEMNEHSKYLIENNGESDKMIEKCNKSGWYLFYYNWRNDIAPIVLLYGK